MCVVKVEEKVEEVVVDPEAKCSSCGEDRTWCELCGVWSMDCCVTYGTCWCS